MAKIKWDTNTEKKEDNSGNKSDEEKKEKKETRVLYTLELDPDGKLIVKDSLGKELSPDCLKIVQGNPGEAHPRYNEETGELSFVDDNGAPISSGYQVKGDAGTTYIPFIDDKTGKLVFKDENGKILTGEYLIKGKNGENGREFIPHTTEDGFLFFTDREGNEIPGTRVKVKGADGKRGVALVPQIDSDGNLHWIKQDSEKLIDVPPINIKGDSVEGPEGATFTPYVKDGVLYWTNNKGLPNPDPIKISGPQGDEGKQGVRGLSAYEIWLKQGYLGTEQDFLDSLKGEKGEAASPANFSYRDVEDFKCKVQKIDTKLIVDSNDPDKSPKEIIEERTNEIFTLRRLGKEKRENCMRRNVFSGSCIIFILGSLCITLGAVIHKPMIWVPSIVITVLSIVAASIGYIQDGKTKKRIELEKQKKQENTETKKDTEEESEQPSNTSKIGWFKEFTWWCAGADKDLLAMCPGDHSKYVGIGTTILFTALMAFFSSFIAFQLVFDPVKIMGHVIPIWSIIAAILWASMIFFLDRFITNTMYSDGKVTISKHEFLSGLPRILIAIFIGIVISAPLELKIFSATIEHEMDLQYDSELQKAIGIAEDNAQISFLNDIRNDSTLLIQYTASKNGAKDQRESLYSQRPQDNIVDQGGYAVTDSIKGIQVVPKGSKNVNAENQAKWDKKHQPELDSLSKLEHEYGKKILEIEQRLAQADVNRKEKVDEKKQKAEKDFQERFDRKLHRQLSTLHQIGMKDYTPWWPIKDTNGNVIRDDQGKVQSKYEFWDIILHSWWWYLLNSAIGLIMLLFILIDISPVLYKMMLADGKYDNYLHQEKLLAQDKIRLSLANMLKGLDDSELKRVAPFVMGDIYSKMAGDSYVYKTEEDYKKEIAKGARRNVEEYKLKKRYSKYSGLEVFWHVRCYNFFYIDLWRFMPFSWLKAIFWKSEEKPSAPVIVFMKKEDKDKSKYEKTQEEINKHLNNVNQEVFNEVLKMKKKIILASYRRWYKTQHDCIICDDINDENKGKEPFEEDSYPPRDQDSKQKGKDPDDKKKEDVKDGTKYEDNSNDESSNNNDPFDDKESFDKGVNTDSDEEDSRETDSNEEPTNETETTDDKESEGADKEDDDEHELPDDDGDDRPKN